MPYSVHKYYKVYNYGSRVVASEVWAMFRDSTSFEQNEYGWDPFPLTTRSLLSDHPSKGKLVCPTGIGPDVLIETEHMGPVPASEIRAGDRVLTLDNGYRPVLWAGSAWCDGQKTVTDTIIQILPGVLGKAIHGQNAYYAPHQHILLRDPLNEIFFGSQHVLARAGFLTHLNGVEQIKNNPVRAIVNLLFDRAEMVQAEGVWVESLMPEIHKSRLGLDNVLAEIKVVIPSLRYENGYAAYVHNLPVLNEKEVKMLSFNKP